MAEEAAVAAVAAVGHQRAAVEAVEAAEAAEADCRPPHFHLPSGVMPVRLLLDWRHLRRRLPRRC